LISDRIYGDLTASAGKGQVFANGYTYSAHPVSCAAALTNLDILEREDICGHVQRLGPYFHDQLKTLGDLDMVGDVRGSHFMVCIECTADKEAKTVPPGDWDVARRIFEKCMPRGLLIRPMGHLIVFSPPLVISRSQIDEAVATLRACMIEVQDDLRRDGFKIG
ncbi:MAG: aminotransferase class III-fold pyridoxal phosphate-dependent enzyme, partial [Dongiaceae bacterium]